MTGDTTRHGQHHPPREPQPVTTPERVIQGWWGTDTDPDDNTPPLVAIHWWDAIAYGTDNWTDDTETPEPCPTISVGWITHNTPHAITVVPLVNPHQWGHGITIPWGCIHHITPLPPPDQKRPHRERAPTT